ncbi:SDR family oxidoreductase [Actinacidiphila soli]|jgi:NAD(P)-dependent dehydrogenase (short-subunit alcohol dehydrogenase family)|uniref:SDR family oxidoreductase n=1 Tax=Actinacidiphila soli TaxID=2487275 RepID=UPI000FCB0CF0|nr:SDR family oxidoreductase [Actinacidiphila soli]
MDLELKDKVVLVTGGSDGLGAALVRRLAAEGARVALCGRDPERVGRVVKELGETGADVLGVPADVTRQEDLERFLSAAEGRWGRIDAIVNNAGRSAAGAFEQQDETVWEEDLQLKLHASVRLIRLALPHLRAAGGGSVVNTLAVSAKAPGAGSTPTSVSRAAGLALTKALSKELGADNIRVNAVLIGLVESGQWVRMAEAGGRSVDELYATLGSGSGIPLGRVGKATEFADLVAFLLSPRAAYISGTGINFDGGMSPVV